MWYNLWICQQGVYVWTAKLSHVKTRSIYFGCSSVRRKCIENQTSCLRNTNPKTANRSQQISWNLWLLNLGISRGSSGIRKESRMFGAHWRSGASRAQRSIIKSSFWLKGVGMWVAETEYFTTITPSSALSLEEQPHPGKWEEKLTVFFGPWGQKLVGPG